MRTVSGTFFKMMICSEVYHSCGNENIAVHYRDILMENNNLAEAKSAINCCKAFNSLSDSFLKKMFMRFVKFC